MALLLSAASLNAEAGDSSDKIPPLRPPRAEIPPTFWEQSGGWVIAGGVLLMILLGAAVWLIRHRKPPVAAPPDAQARQALEPLRARAEDRVLLSRVSRVLRRYFATAFGLPPGELTTSEFCRALAVNDKIAPELSGSLSDFLRQCDERKFAPPTVKPPMNAVSHALEFVALGETRLASLRAPTPPAAPGPTTPAPAKP